jgi:hypothetical protein
LIHQSFIMLLQNPSLIHLQSVLEDISRNVQIESNCCVSHPLYGKAELEPEHIDRFQQLPAPLQQRYLSLQLRNFLHGIYFAGTQTAPPPPTNFPSSSAPAEMANNRAWGLDLDFYQGLRQSNRGDGFFDPGWSVVGHIDGLVAVCKQELTLHVAPDRHLRSGESTELGAIVAVKMPPHRLGDGLYIAVGDAGLPNAGSDSGQDEFGSSPDYDMDCDTDCDAGYDICCDIYFNLTANQAATVMAHLTQHLNALEVPFTFKLPYEPIAYDRHDSAILTCHKSDYPLVRPALRSLCAEATFAEATPLFTKRLTGGVAVAEEPDEKFSDTDTFGLHRCQLLANGLLAAHQQDEQGADLKRVMILNQFYEQGIDLEFCHLNHGSDDVYRI